MFRMRLIARVVAGLMMISGYSAFADDGLTAPKITDGKLSGMRYVGESLVHWTRKMKPGDQRTATKHVHALEVI